MNWFTKNKNSIIRTSFLIPILLVVVISISHVVSWYEIGNPLKWAIYLSVAIEIFALTSVSAATVNINKGTIWFLFILVTMIQLIGNVFFSYNHINIDGSIFKTWVELIGPLFEDWDNLAHKRFLALIQGGTLPIMSLTALHFYLKFNQNDDDNIGYVEDESEDNVNIDYVQDESENKKEVVEKVIIEEPVLPVEEIEIVEPEIVEPEVVKVEKPIIPSDSIKREDIKEVKQREGATNNITRVGTNKYQNGNKSGNIIYDNERKRRNR